KMSPEAKTREDGSWSKVSSRPLKRRQPRPEAVLITGVNSFSYADMLRTVKSDPSLKHLSQSVQGMRKTANGNMVLRLNKGSEQSACDFRTAVEKALSGKAVVKKVSDQAQVEICDLDEITTKEEVINAVRDKLSDSEISVEAVKSLRAVSGGRQIASLTLPVETANKLAEGKIRVGWVVCRLLQLNMNHAGTAHSLLDQAIREHNIDLALLSEPLRKKPTGQWLADTTGKAAIWLCTARTKYLSNSKSASGFAGRSSAIDLTFASSSLAPTARWTLCQRYTASDHRMIICTIGDRSNCRRTGLDGRMTFRVD
ncbi:hypothetical protein KR222_010789, partial [Zaprionus bogoriensis]